MRGEKQQQDLIEQAMKNHPMATMRVIDDKGEVKYHIVTTWWSRGVIIVIGLMLFIMLGALALIAYNNSKINELEKQVEESNTNATTHDAR
jgi:hypothetical protein